MTDARTDDEITWVLGHLIQDHFGGTDRPIAATPLSSLDLDSLDRVELLMAVEEKFDVEIPDDVACKMETVGEIADFIRRSRE